MLDYTLIERSLKEDAPGCYQILKSNFKEDRPIDKEILDFYRELKSTYPKGFPVTEETLKNFWKPKLAEDFSKEAAFLHLSDLDAFTFYAGCAFVEQQKNAENKLNQRQLTLACHLKHYLSLKIAILQPNLISNSNDIKILTQVSLGLVNEMKNYYNLLSGHVYSIFTLFRYHQQIQPLPVEIASIKQEIDIIEQACQQGWLTDPKQEGIRKFDLQLATTLPNIIGPIKAHYTAIELRQAQQNNHVVDDENNDPAAPCPRP